MQITPLWQKFKQIGLLDKQIIVLQEAYAGMADEINTLEQLITERTALIDRMTSIHKKVHHSVSLREADVVAALAKITAKEKQLEEAQSTKQQTAIEHEISSLKKICNDIEDACLVELAELEKINTFIKKEMPELIEQTKRDRSKLEALKQELAVAKMRETQHTSEQGSIVSTITPEWYAKYQEMKTHVADPITPVMQNSCGSCFSEVLAKDLVRLKNNAILPCHGCFRLLYYDPEETQK